MNAIDPETVELAKSLMRIGAVGMQETLGLTDEELDTIYPDEWNEADKLWYLDRLNEYRIYQGKTPIGTTNPVFDAFRSELRTTLQYLIVTSSTHPDLVVDVVVQQIGEFFEGDDPVASGAYLFDNESSLWLLPGNEEWHISGSGRLVLKRLVDPGEEALTYRAVPLFKLEEDEIEGFTVSLKELRDR